MNFQSTPASVRTSSGADKQEQWAPPRGSGLREVGIAFVWACALASPILGFGGWKIHEEWRARDDARLAELEAAQAYERLVAAAAGPMLPLADAVRGRELFSQVCVACHGPAGTGVQGLGRNLVESDFVAGLTDEQFRHFLETGRPDARPVAMPPRGGRDDLTADDLRAIVTFVRGLQDPRRMPELPAMAAATPTNEQKASALAAAGGDAELAEYIASGDRLFHSTCVACHGKGGVGVQGNGKSLVANPFIQGQDDDALLAFLQRGRSPTDPLNTTGIQMPPKGGNPALSEDDLLDIIAYLRTLQPRRAAAAPGN